MRLGDSLKAYIFLCERSDEHMGMEIGVERCLSMAKS